MEIAENVCKNYDKGYYKVEVGKIENGKSVLGLVVERIAIVGLTADSIRYLIRIRILTPDSIRDLIRMQTADSQVPNLNCQLMS